MNYIGHCNQCEYALFAKDDQIVEANAWTDVKPGNVPAKVSLNHSNMGIYARCPENHKVFRMFPIKGKLSTKHKCDSRCMNAKSNDCTCSCGGVNHGRGHAVEVVQVMSKPIDTNVVNATEAQLKFINTLLDEREMDSEKLSATRSRLEEGLTKDLASKWISRLKELPRKV